MSKVRASCESYVSIHIGAHIEISPGEAEGPGSGFPAVALWRILVRCALNLEDIARYDLPPDSTKTTGSHRGAVVKEDGDVDQGRDPGPHGPGHAARQGIVGRAAGR